MKKILQQHCLVCFIYFLFAKFQGHDKIVKIISFYYVASCSTIKAKNVVQYCLPKKLFSPFFAKYKSTVLSNENEIKVDLRHLLRLIFHLQNSLSSTIRENEGRGQIKIDSDKILICKLTKKCIINLNLGQARAKLSLIVISGIRP